jgi:hypothetical protein
MLDVRDVRVIADERAARIQLRGQIAALEAQLSDAVVIAFPHGGVHGAVPAPGGPRLLTLGELERIRDALADRLAQARGVLEERGERQEASRALLERMLLEPSRYKFVRVANRDLGERLRRVARAPAPRAHRHADGWWQVAVLRLSLSLLTWVVAHASAG